MAGVRDENQKVDAFSAPKDLLRKAQLEAKKRRWSKSGFYRYCLARELGYSEVESAHIAEHAAVGNFTVTNGARKKVNYTGDAKRKKK